MALPLSPSSSSFVYESDHSHLCERCQARFSCPLEKRDCRIEWKTTHDDHHLALTSPSWR